MSRRLPREPDEVEEWLRAEAVKMDTGELRELAEKLDELAVEFLSDAVEQEGGAKSPDENYGRHPSLTKGE